VDYEELYGAAMKYPGTIDAAYSAKTVSACSHLWRDLAIFRLKKFLSM